MNEQEFVEMMRQRTGGWTRFKPGVNPLAHPDEPDAEVDGLEDEDE